MAEISGVTIAELSKCILDGTEELLVERGDGNYRVSISDLRALLTPPTNKTIIAFKSSSTQPEKPQGTVWDLETNDITFQGDGWSLNTSSEKTERSIAQELTEVYTDSYLTIEGYVPRYSAYGWHKEKSVGSSLSSIRKSFSSGLDRSTDRSFLFFFNGKLNLGKRSDGLLYYIDFFDLSNACKCSSNDKLSAISINIYKEDTCIASYDLMNNGCTFGSHNDLSVYVNEKQYDELQRLPYDSYSVQFDATFDGNIEAKAHADISEIHGHFVSYKTAKAVALSLWFSVGYFYSMRPTLPQWSEPIKVN